MSNHQLYAADREGHPPDQQQGYAEPTWEEGTNHSQEKPSCSVSSSCRWSAEAVSGGRWGRASAALQTVLPRQSLKAHQNAVLSSMPPAQQYCTRQQSETAAESQACCSRSGNGKNTSPSPDGQMLMMFKLSIVKPQESVCIIVARSEPAVSMWLES